MVTQFPSWLRTYDDCPKKYKFQHIDRRPRRETPALVMGSNVHETLRRFFLLEPAQRTLDELIHLLREVWRHNRKVFAEANPDVEGELGNDAKEMLTKFFNNYDMTIRPLLVEDFIEAQATKELVLKGKVDRVDRTKRGLKVIDYKTGKYPSNEAAEIERDVAAICYLLGVEAKFPGEKVTEIEYLYLREARSLTIQPTSDFRKQKLAQLQALVERINKETYWPAMPGPLCGFCDYAAICPEGTAHLAEVEPVAPEELPF